MLTLQIFVAQGSHIVSTHTLELTSHQKCGPLKKLPNPAFGTYLLFN